MKRVITKIGDVFSVKIDEHTKKYFQLVAFDPLQLNSDVIRAFEKEYHLNEQPDLSQVVSGPVQFYAHCVTKWGIKFELWTKEGKRAELGEPETILFRGTNDYGSKPGEQIQISDKWYVWHIVDASFTRVGKLIGENRKAEIGVVVTPYDIVNRMKTGSYEFVYPGFE